MVADPELDAFRKDTEALAQHPVLKKILRKGRLQLGELDLGAITNLIASEPAYYLLIAAAGLTRTSLKKATLTAEAGIVSKVDRRAFAIRESLPLAILMETAIEKAVSLRARDLRRKRRGGAEQLFRDRLASEKIPVAMSPPIQYVPSLLVGRRKPDGLWPPAETELAPEIYLEVKNINRVSDDIQKRLYEIAEASLEMKAIYGGLKIQGFSRDMTTGIAGNPELRQALRAQVAGVRPIVVALMLCPRAEAERYREGAEAFIDRIFFQEEIDDCLAFLRSTVLDVDARSGLIEKIGQIQATLASDGSPKKKQVKGTRGKAKKKRRVRGTAVKEKVARKPK